MRRLRTTSTRRLLTILACAGVLVTSAAIAQAALTGSGPVPPPKALAAAIKDALGGPTPNGITARIKFTNNLLPAGSLPGRSSALISGADGRLWLAKDGRFRLELQSALGDAQITGDDKHVTVFDASSNTVYRVALPDTPAGAATHDPANENPTLAKIQDALDHLTKFWTVSGATPTSIAGQEAYSVRIAPKDDGGLLGAAEGAWDAVTGAPLRVAIYAQDGQDPVLALEATDISYDAVSDGDVATTPPAGAKVVDLNPQGGTPAQHDPTAHAGKDHVAVVSGVDAVRKQLDFALAAPDKIAGLPRQDARLIDVGDTKGALVTYGKGLGAIAVLQTKADGAKAASGGLADALPPINIDGTTGSELATALGTIVVFQRDGVSYVVAGSVPPVAAENAARGLR
ncbi:MAG: hypothetical protein QOJ35_2705 [Solirubrobacteraceae bacterium]|jgi:outer membrane lipoprotein-sorting protein|nr:hypothetical protein [Solirubrobacteraceae bacterium]